jgi:hypothetical protein
MIEYTWDGVYLGVVRECILTEIAFLSGHDDLIFSGRNGLIRLIDELDVLMSA